MTGNTDRLAHSPARGGDELREAAESAVDIWDEMRPRLHILDTPIGADCVFDALRKALASTDMAGAGDDADRRELDRLLSDWRKSLANPSSWLDRLRAFFAAPSVEGLTSGEAASWRTVANLAKSQGKLTREDMKTALSLIASIADKALAASPKATATASVREAYKQAAYIARRFEICHRILKAAASLTDSGTAATIGGERA